MKATLEVLEETEFPLNPRHGRIVFIASKFYIYDSVEGWVAYSKSEFLNNGKPAYTRKDDKKISIESYSIEFSLTSNSRNVYMNFGGIASNVGGFLLPENATITRLTAKLSGTTSQTVTFQLRITGSQVESIAIPGGQLSAIKTVNLDLPQGNVLQGYVAASNNVNNCIFTVQMNWRD